jgi:altronate dehydratase small subunit
MSQVLLVLDAKDNVATALRLLEPDELIEVESAGRSETLQVRKRIPFGHKVALVEIEAGQPVIKYGEVIGSATATIARGQHVHTHNLEEPKFKEERP